MPTWVRATAETMPWVTVWPTPNGLPIASTMSPTCSSSELPKAITGKRSAAVLDAEHREIGARVLEHDLDLELALVGERDLHLVGAVDDVVVGDDDARGIDDDAGAERRFCSAARRTAARRSGGRTGPPSAGCGGPRSSRPNLDDGWNHALDIGAYERPNASGEAEPRGPRARPLLAAGGQRRLAASANTSFRRSGTPGMSRGWQ